MIAVKKFNLNNIMSTNVLASPLICDCVFDSDNGEVTSHLTREGVASETYRGDRRLVPTLKYTDPFEFKVTLLHDEFDEFTKNEQRQILSWLTSHNAPSIIDFYDDIGTNAPISFSMLGFVSEIDTYKITHARTIGYVVTFESVHPWALSPLQTRTETVTTSNTFTMNCITDDYESLIYPKFVITQRANDTDIVIQNTTLGTRTEISGSYLGEIITLDGTNRVISSSSTTPKVFGDNFNWIWPALARGNNSITITGNYEATISYRYPIKMGEL